MKRSVLLALIAAVAFVALVAWKTLWAIGMVQVTQGLESLTEYANQEPFTLDGVVTEEEQLTALIPKIVDSGVGLVNTPFKEAATEKSQLTVAQTDCVSARPNLSKTAFFLRSSLFDPLNPVFVHHDRNAKLSSALDLFFKEYGYGFHTITTNAVGERVTVPSSERSRKVIVAGGSVAFSAMLDDAGSLASKLQSIDSEKQYVTAAMPEGSAEQILCNLTAAVKRYPGQIDQIIYFYGEEDLNPERKFGTPDEVMLAIRDLARRETIANVTVIYAPTVYNVLPQLTRYKNYSNARITHPLAAKMRLRELVNAANYAWLDIGDIAVESGKAQESQLAALGNFLDDRHLSPYGMNNLATKIKKPAAVVQPPPPAVGDETALATEVPQVQESGLVTANAGLERRIQKQSAAIDQIRAAAGRAAQNNRLKREVNQILKKLKDELTGETASE